MVKTGRFGSKKGSKLVFWVDFRLWSGSQIGEHLDSPSCEVGIVLLLVGQGPSPVVWSQTPVVGDIHHPNATVLGKNPRRVTTSPVAVMVGFPSFTVPT